MNYTLCIIQSLLLVTGQVWLKLGLQQSPPFEWSWCWCRSMLLNWRLAVCGAAFTAAGLLWAYITKHYPLSVAYPLVSLSYVFGMAAAVMVFHETVEWNKWVGVALIVLGCLFISMRN